MGIKDWFGKPDGDLEAPELEHVNETYDSSKKKDKLGNHTVSVYKDGKVVYTEKAKTYGKAIEVCKRISTEGFVIELGDTIKEDYEYVPPNANISIRIKKEG